MRVSVCHPCSGARVHSDSWTTSASTYDANSQNTDLFAWLFQVGTYR